MLKTTATKLFASANSDSTHAIKRAKEQKARLMTAKADMTLLINVLRPVLNPNEAVGIANGFEKPVIYIHMSGLDSFKSERITRVLQVLEAFGTSTGTKDWASIVNRDYKYTMGKFDVTLCAYVRDDSPSCRKIAVGSETQTVVKYEIQCD
jgi:hypothetical protein